MIWSGRQLSRVQVEERMWTWGWLAACRKRVHVPGWYFGIFTVRREAVFPEVHVLAPCPWSYSHSAYRGRETHSVNVETSPKDIGSLIPRIAWNLEMLDCFEMDIEFVFCHLCARLVYTCWEFRWYLLLWYFSIATIRCCCTHSYFDFVLALSNWLWIGKKVPWFTYKTAHFIPWRQESNGDCTVCLHQCSPWHWTKVRNELQYLHIYS
jgi:hypothetical protein